MITAPTLQRFAPRDGPPVAAGLWQGLRGLWFPALGNTGSSIYDLVTQTKRGTLNGGASWFSDYKYPGVGSDGTAGQYIQIPDSSDWALTTTYKLSVWAWAHKSEIISSDYVVIAAHSGNTSGERDWEFRINAGNLNITYWVYNTGAFSTNGSSPPVGVDFTTTATFDVTPGQSKVRKLYLNGLLDAQSTQSSAWTPLGGTNDLWCFSLEGSSGLNTPLTIYALGIWNRVLSPQEIQTLHNNPYLLVDLPGRTPPGFEVTSSGIYVPAPVTLTASVVDPTIRKEYQLSPLGATTSPVSPSVEKTYTQAPITSTASVVSPGTTKQYPQSPITSTASVVATTVEKVYQISPVVATTVVVLPVFEKTYELTPLVATASVVDPTTGLVVTLSPITVTSTVVGPTISKTLTLSPVGVTVSVVDPVSGPDGGGGGPTPGTTMITLGGSVTIYEDF